MDAFFGIFMENSGKVTGVLDKAFVLTAVEVVVTAVRIAYVRFSFCLATAGVPLFGTWKE